MQRLKKSVRKSAKCATYSVAEVAAKLGISRLSGYLAVSRGEIPSIRIGRRILVPKSAFEDFLVSGRPKSAA